MIDPSFILLPWQQFCPDNAGSESYKRPQIVLISFNPVSQYWEVLEMEYNGPWCRIIMRESDIRSSYYFMGDYPMSLSSLRL